MIVARNSFPGVCYSCGEYVPAGFGHFERCPKTATGAHWRVKCVKCASGRTVKETDYEVQRARALAAERSKK